MTTTAMTASPGQRFIGLPSGSSYTADSSGNIAAVAQQDVVPMLRAGASFASTGGGATTPSVPVRQSVSTSATIASTTTDVEINQTSSSTYTLAGGWTNDGFELKIKDVGGNLSPTNVATLSPPNGYTIDGQASLAMTVANEGVKLKLNLTTHNLDVFG